METTDTTRAKNALRRGDTFNDAYTMVLDHGDGLCPASRKRILDLLGSERDAAWAEAKRLKAALSEG